jgi:alkylhydroperoxidase family enzyme
MIRWLVVRHLNALERQVGSSVDYLRHFARVSLSAYWRFALIGPAAAFHQKAPLTLVHTVRLVATRGEGCGSCLQVAVQLAKQDGMAPDLLQAVLENRIEEMPQSVMIAYKFARSVVEHDGGDAHWRNQLLSECGEVVVAELSLALAMARVFPTLKRGLGYATLCRAFRTVNGTRDSTAPVSRPL